MKAWGRLVILAIAVSSCGGGGSSNQPSNPPVSAYQPKVEEYTINGQTYTPAENPQPVEVSARQAQEGVNVAVDISAEALRRSQLVIVAGVDCENDGQAERERNYQASNIHIQYVCQYPVAEEDQTYTLHIYAYNQADPRKRVDIYQPIKVVGDKRPSLNIAVTPTQGKVPFEATVQGIANDDYGNSNGTLVYKIDVGNDGSIEKEGETAKNNGTFSYAFTVDKAGKIPVTVKVSDGLHEVEKIVYVEGKNNVPPKVERIEVSLDSRYVPTTAHLRVVGSDEDGSVEQYACDTNLNGKIDSNEWQTSDRFEVELQNAGAYDVVCGVKDNDGAIATKTAHVEVFENQPPQISLTPQEQQVKVGHPVVYSLSGSDAEGESIRCEIDYKNDGSIDETVTLESGNSEQLTFTPETTGELETRYRCEDDFGNVVEGYAPTVNVVENQPPRVESYTESPTSGTEPVTTEFEVKAYDEDGEIAKIGFDYDGNGVVDDWKVVLEMVEENGKTLYVARGEHTYNAGTYRPKFVIVDNDNAQTVVEGDTIIVSPYVPPNHAPSVSVRVIPNEELNTKQFYTGEEVKVDVDVSDQDGDSLTVYVDKDGDGTADQTFTCGGGNCQREVTLTYEEAGNKRVEVWAVDSNGANSNVASDELSVYRPLSVDLTLYPGSVWAGEEFNRRVTTTGGIGQITCELYHQYTHIGDPDYSEDRYNLIKTFEPPLDENQVASPSPFDDANTYHSWEKVVCQDERTQQNPSLEQGRAEDEEFMEVSNPL
ncbi:hypothetical protein [Phorcysia thermohydrogeniphila]|uniref:Ig-like protein group 3 n=1 Tax=Phorcysia thermohydrogeniphila TaxID=936138 RepID=A0A4R1GEF8_9BACT|nr:hypothetical protein [Phorcysia thermohydrogeniphila]TCK05223.1 hypothetical protein CLV27_0649 [Phorcysia thermohydrogeniphila]